MKKHRTLIVALAILITSAPAALAGSSASSGTLTVSAQVGSAYAFGPQFCPPGTPATTRDCVRFNGVADIPGLGRSTITYVKSFDDTICPDQVTQQKTTLIDVAGKGQLKVAWDYPLCVNYAPASSVNHGTISAATGKFAGASGSFQLSTMVSGPSCGIGGCRGSSMDVWTGNLTVPGYEFDLTPPVLQPIASKRVKAARNAKAVRVRYSPKAQDAVDGPVSVKCKPGSGSLFKVGRTTRVTCSAEDTSANVATASFTVTARKKR